MCRKRDPNFYKSFNSCTFMYLRDFNSSTVNKHRLLQITKADSERINRIDRIINYPIT